MTPVAQKPTSEPGRPVWVLKPLDNVGPLRFGMSADEAEEALPGARELSRFQADPFFAEILGIRYGLRSPAPAVFTSQLGTNRTGRTGGTRRSKYVTPGNCSRARSS